MDLTFIAEKLREAYPDNVYSVLGEQGFNHIAFLPPRSNTPTKEWCVIKLFLSKYDNTKYEVYCKVHYHGVSRDTWLDDDRDLDADTVLRWINLSIEVLHLQLHRTEVCK